MNDVHVAPNGWLFLVGGANKVFDVYSGVTDQAWTLGWAKLINRRVTKFAAKGIKYYHISAPEKLSIYHRYLERDFAKKINLSNSPALLLERKLESEQCSTAYINPTVYLQQQSETYKVYHKTDTHWSFLGAYSVYQLLMNRLGLDVNSDILANRSPAGTCVMDLGGKMDPKITEDVFFYTPHPHVRRCFRNKLVEYKEELGFEDEGGLHVGSSVEFVNEKALHDLRVLIFGDSFSEYRPQLLTGLIAETFTSVKFVWGLSIDQQIVEEFKPDVVITEAAERFMPSYIPKDDFCNAEFVDSVIENHKVKNI
jgi:alginate O-acetyltransferase complex protein AlgJ